MNVIFRVWCNVQDGSNISYALVDVTPELIETVKRRIALLASLREEDRYASSIEFTDYSAEYYEEANGGDDLPEDAENALSDEGWCPAGDITLNRKVNVDRGRMLVYKSGISWAADTGDVEVETLEITVDELSALLNPTEATNV